MYLSRPTFHYVPTPMLATVDSGQIYCLPLEENICRFLVKRVGLLYPKSNTRQ